MDEAAAERRGAGKDSSVLHHAERDMGKWAKWVVLGGRSFFCRSVRLWLHFHDYLQLWSVEVGAGPRWDGFPVSGRHRSLILF